MSYEYPCTEYLPSLGCVYNAMYSLGVDIANTRDRSRTRMVRVPTER
jgi:hypothetical protein